MPCLLVRKFLSKAGAWISSNAIFAVNTKQVTSLRYLPLNMIPVDGTWIRCSAILSHRIRTKSDISSQAGSDPFEITFEVLDSLRSNGSLPSPAVQATNIVRFIGDEVYRSGEAVRRLPIDFHAIIGTLNRRTAFRLTHELVERKTLKTVDSQSLTNIDLTLEGWEQYEAEKRGQFGGNYGFIAMGFGTTPISTPLFGTL